MDELKSVPIHSALNRPNLFMGGERELMLLLALACAMLIFIALTPLTILMGLGIWGVFASLLRMMAKSDPLMSKIYLKQLKYKAFYPAHSTPFRLEN